MNHSTLLDIATGKSAGSRKWTNTKMEWSAFVAKLSIEHKTNETYAEFIDSTKAEQGKIKDVGGYFGGYLRGSRRSIGSVISRQLLTLDIDFPEEFFWEDFQMSYGVAAFIHSTHKHSEENPRLRLIIPLDREVTPEEYVAIARRVAGDLGIEQFDDTTFEVNRLMFWQSTSKDATYFFEEQKGDRLAVDETLALYRDWKDTSLWPVSIRVKEIINTSSKKQVDPETKDGIIGTFCRTYSIHTAIETFLSEEYLATTDGRYSYSKGSTSNGLVTYDDKFAYSHHGTDPCSGKLVNAFDIVRVHKFGHLDSGKTNKISMDEMTKLILTDKSVKNTIAREKLEGAKFDFVEEIDTQSVGEEEEDLSWAEELEITKQGKYVASSKNIDLVLKNDVHLKDVFKRNEFDLLHYISRTTTWRKLSEPESIRDVDMAGLRNFFGKKYGIKDPSTIKDSMVLAAEVASFHPVTEYLSSLKWDGIGRIDSLLPDYFGVEDNVYTREAMRKTLLGAVARVFKPGAKFDLVLTLVGPEGTFKSTFFRYLGKSWFSDTLTTVTGVQAFEQIQGVWIIEIGEMAAMSGVQKERVKHFISKASDKYRGAFKEVSEKRDRQCIFVATTNTDDFLIDTHGNRRFLPVIVRPEHVKKRVVSKDGGFLNEIDQVWAEAMHYHNKKESIYLSKEANSLANAKRKQHAETDGREGLIGAYLETKLPVSWEDMGLESRKNFFEFGEKDGGVDLKQFVCVAEIWCECLGREKKDMSRTNTREVNAILKGLPNWEYVQSTKNFPLYGKQKYYRRK